MSIEKRVLALGKNGNISELKKIEAVDVSYLYPMFLRFGLIKAEKMDIYQLL